MIRLFEQITRLTVLDKSLDDIALNSTQPALRAKAYRSILDGQCCFVQDRVRKWGDDHRVEYKLIIKRRELKHKYPFIKFLNKAAFDSSSMVRRVAAEFLIKQIEGIGSTEAKSLAQAFVNDESSPVSERGKFALKLLDNDKAKA